MTDTTQDENQTSEYTSMNNLNKDTLKDLCQNNADYFSKDNSENGQRLYSSFVTIKENVDVLWPMVEELQKIAPEYDFDESTPGNGYRSFLHIVDCAILYAIQLNKKACIKREGVLFRKTVTTKEIESCAQLIASLGTCFQLLQKMTLWCDKGNLFINDQHASDEVLYQTVNINQYCFYGRSLGFQFCDSIRPVLRFIALSMVIFSEAYYSEGSLLLKATNSVTTTAKYLTDPEQRAKRIVNISQSANVDFCKSFWFLAESELMNQVPTVVGQNVAVSKVIHIPPEPLTLTVSGIEINIPVPTAHIGKKPIQVRLISHQAREGMIGQAKNKNKVQPASRGLLVHCHGGGFVAQSSRSHECYLRQWAKDLQVPILSIDYSLAPEAPYPRAMEEATYAYCWALKNCNLLGSTGENVVVAGDSAGANLLLGTSLKCLSMGLPLPKGLFLAYFPVLVNFDPSPARLLCMMDPLLPFGFLMRCLKAYACPDLKPNGCLNHNGEASSDTESFEEISQSDLIELQAHKSPISETSDTLTYGSLSSPTAEDSKDTVRHVNISDIDVNVSDQSSSQNYVSDFLEKYVLDSDTETDGTKIPVLKQESASGLSVDNYENSLKGKVTSFVANLKGRIENWVSTPGVRTSATLLLDSNGEQNNLDEFMCTVPNDPFLSPYLASDELLRQLPPIRILTVHLDPCLDDGVMFAKKLKNLGNDVKMDILEGLPHGFLNFALLSKEAHEGSKRCIERISELLNLSGLDSHDSEN